MTNRFYIPDLKTSSDKIRLTDKKTVHQITRVLRLKIGDTFFVFSQGEDVEVKILNIQENNIEGSIINKKKKQTESNINITLYQALLKKDNFEWVVQKATELGVKKIVPLVTEHTIIREISKNKQARYEKIAIEATEQCGGIKPPEITNPLEYNVTTQEISKKEGVKIIPWEGEKYNKISEAINKQNIEYHIIIGPEGGFSPEEIEFAKKNNITTVSLGQRILRAETAAIATISLILLNGY